MTRIEELTTNLADDTLSDEEAGELEALLGQSEQARQAYLRILQIEAGLRASRRNVDLSTPIMAGLRAEMAESIARDVMSEIKAQPMPDRGRQSGLSGRFEKLNEKVLPLPFPLGHSKTSTQAVLLALAACVALVIGIWFFGPDMGQPVLAEVRGDGLTILRAGQLIPIVAGMKLDSGDVLRTATNVTAVINFAPEVTRVTLQPGTDVRLAKMTGGKHFDLRAGKLDASVTRQRPFHPMLLTTPQAEARVLGTRFSLTVTTNATRLDVMEGMVRLTRLTDDAAVKVGARRYAIVADKTQLAALPFTGGILRESWSGVSGRTILDLWNDPRYPNQPDRRDIAPVLALEPVKTNHLGVRFRGCLHPPESGDYEFWLTGATVAILSMSPNENPEGEVVICQTLAHSQTWDDKSPGEGESQWAPPVPLVAGRLYYIEAVVFLENGEGHLSVGWKRPGKPREQLTGEYLSPFERKR